MFTGFVAIFIFPTVKDGSISDSLKNVRKSVLIYETIIDLQRLGMETNDKMLVEWIRRLRHLDWVSASERKEMLKKCLASESDRVRDGAMACWLNEEGTFWCFMR